MAARPPQRNIQQQSKNISRPSLIRVPPRLTVARPPNHDLESPGCNLLTSAPCAFWTPPHLLNSLRPRLVNSRGKRQKPRWKEKAGTLEPDLYLYITGRDVVPVEEATLEECAHYTLSVLPRSEFPLIPGCGHFINSPCPEVVAKTYKTICNGDKIHKNIYPRCRL